MLMINFIRGLFVLAGVSLYQIYNHDFLSADQGLVIFMIAFLGLTLAEIIENAAIEGFNQKSPKT